MKFKLVVQPNQQHRLDEIPCDIDRFSSILTLFWVFSKNLFKQFLETFALVNFTMSKIGHLQNCLEDIFDKYTQKFVNKMHGLQLQYKVQKKHRILVIVCIYHEERAVLKGAMYAVSKMIWTFS